MPNTSLRVAEQMVGECRGGTPCADYKWPRTYASQGCQQHSAHQQVAFATAREAGRREGEEMITRFRAAAEKAGIQPGEAVASGDARLPVFQQAFFDEGTGTAASSGEPGRDGGPAANEAAAPQSTAARQPASSPVEARAPGAASSARGVSRSGPRRTAAANQRTEDGGQKTDDRGRRTEP